MPAGFQCRVRQASLLLVLLALTLDIILGSHRKKLMEQTEDGIKQLRAWLALDFGTAAQVYLLLVLEAIGATALLAVCFKRYFWLILIRVLFASAANLWNAFCILVFDGSPSSIVASHLARDSSQQMRLKLAALKDLSLILILLQLSFESIEKPESRNRGPVYNKKMIAKLFPAEPTASPKT